MPAAGVYSFFAVAMDNSGNGVMSNLSTITSTTGEGTLPEVRFKAPLRIAEAAVKDINITSGSITEIDVVDGGFLHSPPVVEIIGEGQGAQITSNIELNSSLSSFGQVMAAIANGGMATMGILPKSVFWEASLVKPGGEAQ